MIGLLLALSCAPAAAPFQAKEPPQFILEGREGTPAEFRALLEVVVADLLVGARGAERVALQDLDIVVLDDPLQWTAGFRADNRDGPTIVASHGFMSQLRWFGIQSSVARALGRAEAMEPFESCFQNSMMWDTGVVCTEFPRFVGASQAQMDAVWARPDVYGTAWGEYYMALSFAVAHEVAHLLYDTVDRPYLSNAVRRDHEVEADLFALKLTKRAGIPSVGLGTLAMYSFLKEPKKFAIPGQDGGHPPPWSRVNDGLCGASTKPVFVDSLRPFQDLYPVPVAEIVDAICAPSKSWSAEQGVWDDPARLEGHTDFGARVRRAWLLFRTEPHGAEAKSARRELERSARKGALQAWLPLGWAYQRGEGGPRSPVRALFWLELAEALGSKFPYSRYLQRDISEGYTGRPADIATASCMVRSALDAAQPFQDAAAQSCSRDCDLGGWPNADGCRYQSCQPLHVKARALGKVLRQDGYLGALEDRCAG